MFLRSSAFDTMVFRKRSAPSASEERAEKNRRQLREKSEDVSVFSYSRCRMLDRAGGDSACMTAEHEQEADGWPKCSKKCCSKLGPCVLSSPQAAA